jgi:hypothetical protein
MKYARIIPLALVALINFTMLQAKTYTIGDGGQSKWNGKTGDDCGCPDAGNNCKVSNSIAVFNLEDHISHWVVSGVLDGNQADITFDDGTIYTQNIAFGNYTFPSGYFEVQDGEFPGVPGGTRINLAGVVTDAGGRFVAQIKK